MGTLWQQLSARWRPDALALTGDTPDLAFGALHDAVIGVAARLHADGLTPGDVVAIQLPKGAAFLQTFLACAHLGLTSLPVNPRATAHEVAEILSAARVTRTITRPLSLGDGPAPSGDTAIAVLMATSGTTGRPKCVALTAANVLATVDALVAAWDWRPDDVLLHTLPLHHVHGLFVAQLAALRVGATTLWHSHFDAQRVADALPSCTIYMGVPTHYRRLLGTLPQALDLSKMRLFTSGSAPLPAALHDAWRARTGLAILERYGMTEVGIVLANPLAGPRQPGRVGLPLPGVRARVVHPETRAPLPDGEVGMLQIAGPSVFSGYLHNPEATREALSDGWMWTGDLACRDGSGSFAIAGRATDLVLTGGFNVYPQEVERALLSHAAVAEAAATGVPDADLGERVAAGVVLAAPCAPETLRAHLRTALSAYKVPKILAILEEIPRNAMGKADRRALGARLCPVVVRAADATDAAVLTQGNVAMARETEDLALNLDTVSAGVQRVLTSDVGAHYVIAERAGVPVGQLMVTTEWSDWRAASVWWIQSVYVVPRGRRLGVYRALYAHVCEQARAAGAAGVRLYVDRRNTTAQAVYTRLGMNGDHYQLFEAMFRAGTHPADRR